MSWVLSLFSSPGATPSPSGSNPVAALRLAEAARDREMEAIRREPGTRRAVERFERGIERARSVGELLDNPDVRNFLLKSLGIPDLASAPALVRRALLSDPAEAGGLHERLNNTRLTEAARSLKLYEQGIAPLRDAATRERLRDGWVRAEWFDRLRAREPAVADALLFRERAANFAGSSLAILGDPIMRRVVTAAVGLPQEIAVMSVEAQTRALNARFDSQRLADPRFVERLAQRYAMLGPASGGNPALAALPGYNPLNFRI